MMVGAITFDLGGMATPVFPMPDASGLVPLSLPEEFLRRHESPLPQPSYVLAPVARLPMMIVFSGPSTDA